MSRTSWYKAGYFSGVIGIGAILVYLVRARHLSEVYFALVIVLLLVPGRILGWFWRDLLRGLHLMRQGEFEESAHYSQAFLQQVKRRPWIRNLIWLGSSSYSRDPEALALNNLGAAQLGMGDLAAAESSLEASIAVDAKNPLPYYNLSRLAMKTGDAEKVTRYLDEARRLGFTGGVTDRIVMGSQRRFAASDSRVPKS